MRQVRVIDDTRELARLCPTKDEGAATHGHSEKKELKTESKIIFLKTKQNENFIHLVPNHIQIIEREELKNYFNTNLKVIGITGTNGKTTTAAAIYSMLLDSGAKAALLGTRGFFANDSRLRPKGLTTPPLLELYENLDWAARLGCEYFVMEVSSHAIKQERIYGIDFFMKIITNITSDHLDYHGTLEDYANTKLDFIRQGGGLKLINLDCPMSAKLRFLPGIFSYGIEAKGHLFVGAYSLKEGIFAQLTARRPSYSKDGHQNSKRASGEASEEASLTSPLFGLFNLYNLLAATLATKLLKSLSLQAACMLVSNFAGVAGRMEVISQNPLIIVDFAHTTDGLKQVFESFKLEKISVVFGAGGDRDRSKRPRMGACAATYAQKIYITNDNPRSEDPAAIASEIQEGALAQLAQNGREVEIKVILDRREAIRTAIAELEGGVLLVLGKGDEATQTIGAEVMEFSDRECIKAVLDSSPAT